MTESQTLLAEYARTGSETAFRELVTRYLGLVYAAALRLVEGDTHLAEDVAQTVFTDLARKARDISSEVMLGGWLHRRTFHVAAPMMRANRRRQQREREAAQMNTTQPDSRADLAGIVPILDEAITHLEEDDRTAILLRFFERRDFRAIGQELGSTEDAARMRVNRALNKLQVLITREGVTLSAAALGTALASESLTAAPAGLAASLAASALASSAGTGGLLATLPKILVMTKLHTGIITAIVVAGAATSLLILNHARAVTDQQEVLARQQSEQLAKLTAENERLSKLAAQSKEPNDQLADLLRLRAEAGALRKQTNSLAPLLEQSNRLQQQANIRPRTPLQTTEAIIARVDSEKNWLLAFRMYAMEHGDRLPTNFDLAASFLRPEFKAGSTVSPDEFEILSPGSLATSARPDAIVLRERNPLTNTEGKVIRVYGMADGSVQQVSMPSRWGPEGKEVNYDSFEVFERDHMVSPPSQ